jgi:hypothetical protein
MHIYKLPSPLFHLERYFEKQKRHEKWEGMDVEMGKKSGKKKRRERK